MAITDPKHLPYQIDPARNRFHYYENYWKHCGLKLLSKHVPVTPGTSILDYGCGRGEALEIFGAPGYSVTGTDADPKCVEIAGRHGPSVLLDLADPVGQFGEKSFDVVICFHVLEHVDNPKLVATQLGRIARKAVVVAVPNLCNLTGLFRRNANYEVVNEGHLQSWDHGHFQSMMERHAGLELVEWGFDTTILPVFNRFAPKFLGQKGTIWLETQIFPKLFPFHGISVLGLFRPKS